MEWKTPTTNTFGWCFVEVFHKLHGFPLKRKTTFVRIMFICNMIISMFRVTSLVNLSYRIAECKSILHNLWVISCLMQLRMKTFFVFSQPSSVHESLIATIVRFVQIENKLLNSTIELWSSPRNHSKWLSTVKWSE